ncbi:MAG: sugar transferase [Verrucomicrobia bacterium]|nr:sugar transferase [Verrucomicrobiota bacterium]
MLRRQKEIRTQVQRVIDAALFALSFWLAHWIRFNGDNFGPWFRSQIQFFGGKLEIQPFEAYSTVLLLILPLALVLLESQGFYNRPLIASRRQTAWQLLKACTLVTVSVVIALFFLKVELARAVIVLFGALSFVLVMLKEILLRLWVETKVSQDQLKKRLILAGTVEDTARIRAELKRRPHDDIVIADRIDLNVSSIESLVESLHEHSANAVLLSAKHTYFGQVEKVIQACELEGVEVWLMADFFKTQISQTALDEFYGRPMLVFRSAPEASWQGVAKHALDLVGAFFLLLLSAIPMLVIAALIKRSSPGPVFFRQSRSGLNGKPFTMYKFRSMATDAEQRKHELAVLNEMDGPVFKVTNDPRVTPIGRWLRKYSLDEFPQLFNVLRGEMSLVGPRPLPVDEVRRFDDVAHRRRLSVKPGLTCLWQVSGRNNVCKFEDWVRLDLEYIDNWSIWLDFKILFRTIPVVLAGTGAK